MTHAAYDAIGRVEGALASCAEQTYAALDPGGQQTMRRILVQMVRPGGETEDTHRVATCAEWGEEEWALAQRLAGAHAGHVAIEIESSPPMGARPSPPMEPCRCGTWPGEAAPLGWPHQADRGIGLCAGRALLPRCRRRRARVAR
ncbi:MAG: hypothetical protein JXA14_09965 [Anaerolineae bacterium]|nr:hypothetical protein [Anaerolineae bacterium]